MSEWTSSDPGAGSMAGISASQTTLNTMLGRVNQSNDDVYAAVQSVGPSSWSGIGVDVWTANAIKIQASSAPLNSALVAARAALSAYQSAVEAIQRQQVAFTDDLRMAQHLRGSIPFIRAPWDSDGIQDDEKKTKQAQSKETLAHQGLARLAAQRADADAALVTALRKAVPPEWAAEHKAFHAMGIDKASQATPDAIAAAMAKLAQEDSRLINGLSHPGDLLALLKLYGDDTDAMTTFFTDLGGAHTVDLITLLGSSVAPGNHPNQQTLEIADRLRAALSGASQGWDPAFGAQFADQMLHGDDPAASTPGYSKGQENSYIQTRIESIGWLFADSANAPLGSSVTLEMATKLTAWEAEYKQPFSTGLPPSDPSATASRLYALQLQNGDYGQGWLGVDASQVVSDDATGTVLQTLGKYPDSSATFLEGLGSAGVKQLFETRDWTVNGFAGPASVIFGAELADGGPGSAVPFGKGSSQLDSVVSQALTDLSKNGDFKSENLSDDAAIDLAKALGLNINSFNSFVAGEGDIDDSAKSFVYQLFGSDETREGVGINQGVWSKILGEVAANQQGAVTIGLALQANEDANTRIGLADPALLDQALHRNTLLNAFLNGSQGGAEIQAALRADQANDANIDNAVKAAEFLIGLIPFGGPEIGGIDVVGAAAGAGEGGIGDWIGDILKDSQHKLADVESLVGTSGAQSKDAQKIANALALYDAHHLQNPLDTSLPAPPPSIPNESAADFLKKELAWYDKLEASSPTITDQLGALNQAWDGFGGGASHAVQGDPSD